MWKGKRLDYKVVIVTGANTGIGKAAAEELVLRGARVIMGCRNLQKAEAASEDIRQRTNCYRDSLVVMKLDLADFQSVRDFATQYNERETRLDILINNAGAYFKKRRETEEGYELTFKTNHLGPFLLTSLLLDRLKASAPSRIVNVSGSFKSHGMDWDDLMFTKRWYPYSSYAQSKLANFYHAKELANRLEGEGVTAYSVHPGLVRSELYREVEGTGAQCPLFFSRLIGFSTPKRGCKTILYCCLADDIKNGGYFWNCKKQGLSSYAKDPEQAKRLWQKSEELVGLEL